MADDIRTLDALPDILVEMDPRKRPKVIKLKERFLRDYRRGVALFVDTTVKLGRVLEEIRVIFEGEVKFKKWVEQELPIHPATAYRYLDLAELAEEDAPLLEERKGLGTAKLYEVARLEPDQRDKWVRDTRNRLDELIEMTLEEFQEEIRPYRGDVRPPNPVKDLRRGISGIERGIRTIRDGIPLGPIEDDDARRTLRKRLNDAARDLRTLAGSL